MWGHFATSVIAESNMFQQPDQWSVILLVPACLILYTLSGWWIFLDIWQIKQFNASWTGCYQLLVSYHVYHEWIIYSTCSSATGSVILSRCVQFLRQWGEDIFSSVPSACLEPLTHSLIWSTLRRPNAFIQYGYADSNFQVKSGCGLYHGN